MLLFRELRDRNSRVRRNSIPEREIDTEDTENAQLQVTLAFLVLSRVVLLEQK